MPTYRTQSLFRLSMGGRRGLHPESPFMTALDDIERYIRTTYPDMNVERTEPRHIEHLPEAEITVDQYGAIFVRLDKGKAQYIGMVTTADWSGGKQYRFRIDAFRSPYYDNVTYTARAALEHSVGSVGYYTINTLAYEKGDVACTTSTK